MDPQLRLLFVDNDVNSFYWYRIELARAVKAAGFEVHIACPPGKAASVLTGEGFIFHEIGMTRKGTALVTEWQTIRELITLYRKLQPDLIHHLRLKPVLYGGIAARYCRVPAVAHLLTGLGHVFTAKGAKVSILRTAVTAGLRIAFRQSNQCVIFQNPDDRNVFLDAGLLAIGQTAMIRGSGVDMTKYSPSPELPGTPVVILASRMLREKGVVEFVEAARQVHACGLKARFILVGDCDAGNPTAIPQSQLTKWHESGIVEWWGHREDVHSLLKQAHIVCLPSMREGVPRVLIEAAACGRPIVTTDAPGCREIVRHGVNGLLVPVGDSLALAGALRTLLENPELRLRMGQEGRRIAVNDFSLVQVIEHTMGVYSQLLPAFVPGKPNMTVAKAVGGV